MLLKRKEIQTLEMGIFIQQGYDRMHAYVS